MKPLLLLILELPAAVELRVDSLAPQGNWREPLALADAALASLLTGVGVDAHGALSEQELRPDGQALRLAPRHRLMHSPCWEQVEGAVAVGLPWSTGSRAGKCVVSPEFVRSGVPGPQVTLPDRVWPEAFNAQLAPACIAPEELDAATLAELGFAAHGANARYEIAEWLSLHSIATALLELGHPPLLILRLRLALEPENPAASSRFVEAVLARYRYLWGQDELRLLIRHRSTGDVECAVFGTAPTPRFESAIAMGLNLATRFGLSPEARRLPAQHWATLRARYQPPANTLPGTAAQIQSLVARVNEGLGQLQSPA